jgi:hypothetical protein
MPEVLSRSGVPIVDDFAGGKGTPIVVDEDTGRAYVLVNNTVTALDVFQVVLTASLPAASTAMNGTVVIEDAGTGDRNLIVYAGGQRFRIDGGTAF